MATTSAHRPYRLLAQYYDQFFIFHLPWYRRARRHLLAKVFPQMRSACDLACGTGTTALELARRGIRVFAVDLSPAMCRLAREKAVQARIPLRVRRGDMRTFRLPETVDLVTCEYDALNHVPHKADLARVARAVARALAPGGYFYFDVNNRLAFEIIWPGTWRLERPRVVLITQGGYDRRRQRGWINTEWFIRERGCWRRFRERVEEVCWSPTEIRRTLRAAGFERIRAWDATLFFRGHPAIRPGCRTFYLARKSRRLPRQGRPA